MDPSASSSVDALLDELAEQLLADAVAVDLALDAEPAAEPAAPPADTPSLPAAVAQPDPPVMGDSTSTPDMGDQVTQPANPGTGPAQPAPVPPTPAPVPAPVPQPAPGPVPGQPVPNPAQQPPTPFPTPPSGGQGTGQPAGTPVTGSPDVYNYPENTAVAQMTVEQQAEYWRHKARKHEDRVKQMANYDELKAAYDKYQELVQQSQTEQEKAVAAARQAGAQEAMAQVGGQLVEQWFHAAVAGRLPEDRVNTILDGLDRRQFLGQNGGVDADKVRTFVEMLIPAPAAAPAASSVPEAGQQPAVPAVNPALAPAPPRLPDFGQGTPARSRPAGLEAGREIARARFGQKPATTNAAAS